MRRVAFALGGIVLLTVFVVTFASRSTAQERRRASAPPEELIPLKPASPGPGDKLFNGNRVTLRAPGEVYYLASVEYDQIGNYWYFVGKPLSQQGAVIRAQTVWVRQDRINDITVHDDANEPKK